MTDRDGLISLAKIVAAQYNLTPSLVCGICEQESSWNPDATRYESGFFAFYIEPMIHDLTLTDMNEAKNRATSWGLMQIMGETAREFGYIGQFPFPSAEMGIRWGCEKFSRCLANSKGDVQVALLRYNGGKNEFYPREVMNRAAIYGE